jgi:hypothetical protein
MSASGPFGIARSGTHTFESAYETLRRNARTALSDRVSTAFQPRVDAQSPAGLTPGQVRAQLRAATSALVDAFREYSNQTTPVFRTSLTTSAASAGAVTGLSPRLTPVAGSFAGLQTTRTINSQTSTVRSSSSALGLNLDGAASRLSSSPLGFDVTSPGAASRLTSSAGLNLDLSTPESPSSLWSSSAIGLDLTSPDAASRLSSSVALGLDLTTPEAASVLRSSVLGLDNVGSTSRLASTAEMNTATTSYGSTTLNFDGSGVGSTSVGTLSGTYTGVSGAADASSLTFKVTQTAVLNDVLAASVKFEVRDQSNTLLYSFDGSLRAGDQVYLGDDIGLSVSFSAGRLANNHTASTSVSHGAVDVDAGAAFNASAALRPQFDGGAQVTAGSFSINGTSITVNANDTINSVLSRINASAAGVTATLQNDRITLTSSSASESDIVIGSDTSGFLSATRLSGATTTRGNLVDSSQALSGTSRFGSVSTGSFTVNGASISVDRNTDSLASIVDRINSAGACVTAEYDASEDKVILTGTSNSEDLIEVANDTSGFLAAAGLSSASTVRGNVRDDQQTLAKTSQFGAVTSGSFTVNGATISVDASTDTLASLVDKINDADAGVIATYDSGTDRIVLAGTVNSQDLIRVGNDSTGFLAAAGLATSNTVRGHLAEDGVALADIDEFASVVDGSFEVDGQEIDVDAETDTVQSIVDKINESGARVSASYDAATDRIRLVSTYNGEGDVPVGSDTSGFLAAANLSAANTVAGNISDDRQVLSQTSQFGSVTSGSFSINGRNIDVDADADTLESLLDKINASGAGVTAGYNAATDRIELVGVMDSEDIIDLASDTTGFLTAARLDSANTARGNVRDDRQVLSRTTTFGSVTSGTFRVNGRTITLDAGQDTLESLLDKINEADAGVTATFDATTDTIELVSEANSEDLIQLTGDDTGLLQAAGLVTANTTRGNVADDEQALSATSRFASVTDGSFRVNGVSISVDADEDTLQSIAGRINTAGVGVTARYDAVSDRLIFTPSTAGATLTLDTDTTGFLTAASVSTGTVGTHVNSSAAFNATGASGPLFDPGVSVQAGSFAVNGVTIDVAADDSIDSVLDRLSRSDAGVIARYDDTTQTVRLTSKRAGGDAITLGSDTSGFLAAVKLDGTAQATTADNLSVFDTALADIAELSSVRSGVLTVNGVQIAVDPARMTIRDLVSRLDAHDDVTASLNEYDGSIRVSAQQVATDLVLVDTSGALSALGIAAGTYQGANAITTTVTLRTGTSKVSNANDVAARVGTAVDQLNTALSQFVDGRDRAEVEEAVRDTIERLAGAGAAGLSFSTEEGKNPVISVDQTALADALHALPASGTVGDIQDLLDTLGDRVTAIAGAQPQNAQLASGAAQGAEQVRARLAADQASASLLALKPVLQTADMDPAALKRAAEAYADKSIFAEIRALLKPTPNAAALLLLESVPAAARDHASAKRAADAYGLEESRRSPASAQSASARSAVAVGDGGKVHLPYGVRDAR